MNRETEKIIEKALGKGIEEVRNTFLCELPRKKAATPRGFRSHEDIEKEFCKALGIKEKK